MRVPVMRRTPGVQADTGESVPQVVHVVRVRENISSTTATLNFLFTCLHVLFTFVKGPPRPPEGRHRLAATPTTQHRAVSHATHDAPQPRRPSASIGFGPCRVASIVKGGAHMYTIVGNHSTEAHIRPEGRHPLAATPTAHHQAVSHATHDAPQPRRPRASIGFGPFRVASCCLGRRGTKRGTDEAEAPRRGDASSHTVPPTSKAAKARGSLPLGGHPAPAGFLFFAFSLFSSFFSASTKARSLRGRSKAIPSVVHATFSGPAVVVSRTCSCRAKTLSSLASSLDNSIPASLIREATSSGALY